MDINKRNTKEGTEGEREKPKVGIQEDLVSTGLCVHLLENDVWWKWECVYRQLHQCIKYIVRDL